MNGGSDSNHPLELVSPSILAEVFHLDLSRSLYNERTFKAGGAYGDIFKGQCLTGEGPVKVAIKRLRFYLKEDIKALFEKEIHVWSKLRHNNILRLMGYAFDIETGYPLLISEWMENGSSRQFLRSHPNSDVLHLVTGIASGVAYLHRKNVVHSDLKPDNILVSASGDALICDFGLSRMIAASHSLAVNSSGVRGTPPYQAYELLTLSSGHTEKTDVWAFGMTVYELAFDQRPFAGLTEPQVISAVQNSYLPHFPAMDPADHLFEVKRMLMGICVDCWKKEPDDRSDMDSILTKLGEGQNSHQQSELQTMLLVKSESGVSHPSSHKLQPDVEIGANIAKTEAGAQCSHAVHSAHASNTTEVNDIKAAGAEEHGELYEAVDRLLRRLQSFEAVMDTPSELHSYIRLARSLTSALYDAVRNVFDADRKVIELVRTMADTFEFVQNVQKLRDKVTTLQQSIDGLLKQTIECCIFIREYTSHDFAGRMRETDATQKIEEFRQSLLSFKRETDSGVALHTPFVSVRDAQAVDKLLLQQLLSPSQFDSFDRPGCLPGTRLQIRDKIIEWAFSMTPQNIFWFHGVAGSGKSTVSTTIASHFRQMSRLGAFLFFERSKSEPSAVIRTIAYSLALFDASIEAKIVSESRANHDIVNAPYMDQFRKLLLHPLTSAGSSMPGPVVIVLDALDECGTPETRRGLTALMRNEFPKLPTNFRFLVTSRREIDIDQAFSSCSEFVCEAELDFTSSDSQRDVFSFLHTELDSLRQNTAIQSERPCERSISLLGKASGGLFIWASTAIKMVKDSDSPFYELDTLVSSIKSSRSEIGLDELYATVLRNSGIKWKKESSRNRFSRILSLLLLSKVPLSTVTVDGILGLPPEEPSTLILSRLRSVITYSGEGPISLLHASFSDYLVSSKRLSDPWCIDFDKAKHFIAERCFAVMKDLLRFNICNLESSFVRNDDVSDLAERIRSRIPPHLEYACLHWAHHLIEAPSSSELLKALSDFTYHRLLFWFEVLSLIKAFGRTATVALSEVSRWSESHDSGIASFLRDGGKLASIFGTPIIQSVPHIYASMVPFSECDSEVAVHYSKDMSSLIQVEQVGVKGPPLCLRVFEGHSREVNSVAFSPNGRHVVSASSGGTVRVWDIDGEEEILEPLVGRVACFSPDSRRIVSGSRGGDLRVCDAHNGDLALGPLKGHTGWVNSVAWSPDGMMIASGSDDEMAILWNAADGNAICRLSGHTDRVRSVAFSPDSSRLASGSDDETIRIWDVRSGKLASEPFEGHSDWVRSVAFSPDGKHVVSGSNGGTIKVWEAESGSVLLTLEGHTRMVTSVVYSPCGTRIVSGSRDKTIRVWDAQSGEIISTLEGHTDIVTSVAVSPDGKSIASGSDDATARVWDATIRCNSKASTKHSNYITSIAFSPDGRRIASASWDETIIVWDARTGDAEYILHGHTDSVNCVAFVPNSSRLVSGSDDETVRIWDTEMGESASEPPMHTGDVHCIAVSPDGSTLACGTSGRMISVWSIATGQLVAGPLQGHSDWVNSIAFSPNGKQLASGSRDEKIIIWNTDDWEAIHEHLTGHSSDVMSVCFSPDGSRIASGSRGKAIIVWDAESGQKIAGPFVGHAGSVSSLVFSLDGRHLISGSRDRTIRVWDADSGQTIFELEGHKDWVRTLALSPDGCTIISGSDDNTIRVWNLSDILQLRVEHTGAVETSFSEWVLGENGWILGGRDRRDLLAWIPPDLRGTLCLPHSTATLSCDFYTKLNLTGAALGEGWAECFNSASES